MRIQNNLEKAQIVREVLQNLDQLPDYIVEEAANSLREEHIKRATKKGEKPTDVYSKISSRKLRGDKDKDRISIDALPTPDERTLASTKVFADKMDDAANIFNMIASNARDKNFYPKDPDLQKELILGVNALVVYMTPLGDDKFAGDWKDYFNPVAERLRTEQHWSEEPKFIRDYRYQIFTNGEIQARHAFTREHYLGDSIIHQLNNIIMISQCSQFLSSIFMQNYATRYQQGLKKWAAMRNRTKQ